MSLEAILTVGITGIAAYLLYHNTHAIQDNTIALRMGPYTVIGPAPNYVPLNCPPGQYSGSTIAGVPACMPIGSYS